MKNKDIIQAVIDVIPHFVLVTDRSSKKKIIVNTIAQQIEEQSKTQQTTIIRNLGDLNTLSTGLEQLINDDSISEIDCYYEGSQYDKRTLRIAKANLNLDEDEFSLISGVDISTQKKAEEKIRDNELLITALFDNAQDAIFIMDELGFILECNKQTELYFEKSKDEIIGKSPLSFSPQYQPDGTDTFEKGHEYIQKTLLGVPQHFEFLHAKDDGRQFYVSVNLRPVTIDNQRFIVANINDITDSKEYTKNIAAIINSTSSYFILLDQQGNMLALNKIAEQYIGKDGKTLIGSNLFTIHGQSIVDRSLFQQVLKSGDQQRINVQLHNQFYESNLLPIKDDTGKVLRVVAYLHDVSKLKNAYDEIDVLKNQLEEENNYLREEITAKYDFEHIITQNKEFKKVLHQVGQVAETSSSVLINGETGTGKELIARAIHGRSERKDKPLIKINCAAIPKNLIESELFGHEKGAFTGAINQKVGRIELADKGTLFLDEVGEMHIELQSKLLRVLQEGEFERVGSNKTIKVDIRVLSATNRNLEEEIERNNFRSDLYYRLNVFPIEVPPLRERKDDIPLLVNYLLSKFNNQFGKNITKIPVSALNKLLSYDWPGNIRELENVIERAIIVNKGSTLSLDNWQASSRIKSSKKFVPLDEYEREYLIRVLEATRWKVSGQQGAAEILGMKSTTLFSRMQKLGISKPEIDV